MSATPAFALAATAEMLFIDLPVVERVRRIWAAGFDVEIWDWRRHDIGALAATGARFVSMTGYTSGSLGEADGADELVRTARESIVVAERLGCRTLNLHGTGLDGDGLPVRPCGAVTGDMWLRAADTLRRIAELGEVSGVTFCLENLNTEVDHPGTPFARASDTHALVAAVDHPAIRMNLDLYHAQIGEGNLIELVRACLPHVGEIQVADVPGRCEPGTGEVSWPTVARTLAEAGYRGTVALEAYASHSPELALERFRGAFTLVDR